MRLKTAATDPLPPAPSPILDGLNPAQAAAVGFGEGPLLIVAGAGTGKTTVLTRRIAYLIATKKAAPREILALTFTDKAAQEMEDRVDRLVPYGYNDVRVSTFHSFGDRILRENAFDIGLSPDVRVLSQPEAIVFLRENLSSLNLKHFSPLSDPTRFIESLLTAFSRAKDEEAFPEDWIASARKKIASAAEPEEKEEAEKSLEAGLAYAAYESLKTERGFIDFGDQVLLALKVLKERPSALKKIQKQFRYILVDEFQDTNFAQFELLKALAEGRRNITVVGDDDQSIYKFRGACLSNILGFRKAYPEARQIVLQENYRSTQVILDSAYKLIQHNNPDRLEFRDRINKYLHGQIAAGEPVVHRHFDTVSAECEFIAATISERLKNRGAQPKNFAVLLRTNASAEPFIKTLNLAGIPWRFSGSSGLYEQEEIRVILSFLRALSDPEDSASLYYLAASPLYGLDSEDLARLTQSAQKLNRPLFEVFRNCAALLPELELKDETCKMISEIGDDLVRFRELSGKVSTGVLLYQFLEEKGTLKRLAASPEWSAVQEAQNLQSFFELIKRFSQVSPYDRPHLFIRYLDALRIAGEDRTTADHSADDNAVHILTAHAAKGLEFETVFLAGLEKEHFPLRDRADRIEIPEDLIKDVLPSGDYHIQEERRLFYVGMTRAKSELILTSASDHGGKKSWKPSQFVLEALDKPGVDEQALKSHPLESLKIFAPAKEPAPDLKASLPKKEVPLSATSVEDYLHCPLKFKFSRILRIPVLRHHSTVFGIAIHEALKAYHTARKEGQAFKAGQLLEIFKRAWKSEGFISREHEERRYEEGLKVLRGYFKAEQKSKTVPAFVEEDFRMSLGGAVIRGRWDRIDADGESVVIDYKTGDVKDQKAADQKARKSTQLGLYALAYHSRFGRYPDKLTLHFVKFGIKGTVSPTEEWLGKTIKETEETVEGVLAGRFNPSPGYECRWCAYEKICPALRKG